MGRRAKNAIPRATVHKGRGHERLRIDGRTLWLGRAGSERAKTNYQLAITAWAANGSKLPDDFALPKTTEPTPPRIPCPADLPEPSAVPTVADLALATIAEVGGGKSTDQLRVCSRWWRLLAAVKALEPYADLPAVQFGPRLLREVSKRLATEPMPRKRNGRTVTRTATAVREIVSEIRRIFSEAVVREELPPERLLALQALRKIPTEGARPPEVRQPVPAEAVEATCSHLPPVVADLLRFVMLTGSRPGEAEAACRAEFDTSGTTWIWQPRHHKTTHLGKSRVIAVGPKARQILKRWWSGKTGDAVIFSRSDLQRAKTSSTIRMRPLRKAGDKFESGDLRQRVQRAAKKAGVERWCPYQLRHTGLTETRKAGGLDAAQAQAGHSSGSTTERYAKPDITRQAQAIERIG